jgi:translation initiation factor IF-2
MSIRLNKALRELNIGLQTAVEFLEKKSELGEVKPEPSFKLNDEQYDALVAAFQQDKEVRNQAEKLQQKKPKEKKVTLDAKENRAESLLTQPSQQQFKPLGKIDLDNLGKKPADNSTAKPEPKKESQPVTAATSQKEEKKEEHTSAAKPATTESEQPAEPSVKANTTANADGESAAKQQNEKPVVQNNEAKTEQGLAGQNTHETPATKVTDTPANTATANAAEPEKTESELFTTKSEKKMLNAPKVNVLGKIDLSALNQSTRPKKKSKEEKRKEREEKSKQQGGEKKKRERINKVRVDINAASNQVSPAQQGANKNNNAKKKKNHKSAQKPLEVNDEDVARQVKETLARLTNKQNQNKKGAKYRKEKREAAQEKMNEERMDAKKDSKTLKLTEFVTVSELATMMNVSVNQVIGTLMSVGIMVSINQRLDAETINLVADEFGFKTEYVSAEVQEAITEVEDDENDLVPRAPIVTVMGHVDHGKTSLLDYIRKTNVIAGEAGGITQHIGAYNVKLEDGRRITFLDTPGHEAFTAMRARGAQVTDIAIIIIAADDAVMPTTKEAIAHAQAANVPMVFAINKIDKPGANPDRVREELSTMNLLVEEWGGKYQCQEISAKKGTGVNELMEKVLLEAEMLDLKANPNRKATGSIIESSLDKGRGYVSTVLVSNGTLRVGDNVIAGTSWGRIKAMFNERNARIESSGPAEPCIILGLNGAPTAGDSFHVLETEQEARDIANKRLQLQREQGLRTQKRLTLSDISHRIALGSFKELNIIVKGDTDGSIEALSDSFIKMSTEKIKVDVIHKAVGQISESDVTLADASDAIIVGFQVRPSAAARKLAEQEGVEINTYSVIYDAIDDVKSAMIGMLDKVKKEVVTGQVEVREVYKISKVGTVAGCMVTEGKVHRSDKARVIRDGIVVHTAEIAALKRYKDDVKEVATNFECGISLVNFNDIQQGDMLETFTEVEVKQTL